MIDADDQTLEHYLDAARTGDHLAATALVLELLNDGAPPDEIVDQVLIAALREAGRQWWRNEWTIADEHLVTTSTAAVVEALSSASGSSASGSSASGIRPGAGHLVVVCAEGDWHGLPGRLFSEQMRFRGWRVSFLGASTPADHVAEFLGRSHCDGLAITCASPLSYAGAARVADVGHAARLPVLIGGAGITPNPRRALELGADAVASSPEEASTIFRQFAGTPVVRPPTSLRSEAFSLEADADDLAAAAFADLEHAFPPMQNYDERQRQRTLDDLIYIVRFLAAAILVDDHTVWQDFDVWQRALLAARGVPEEAFDAAVAVLANRMEDSHPQVIGVLTPVR